MVREYDDRWPAEYRRERRVVSDLLDALVERIEHVGSTAVPGLASKPMIDMALGFADRDLLEEGRARLLTAGYHDRGDLGERGGVVVTKGPESNRTHILHLVLSDSDQWRRFVAFRDALRTNPELREEYATLKRGLASKFPENRDAYVGGKIAFIDGATKRRLAESRGDAPVGRP